MLVFIDESGDPGMKGKPGSSDYFVVTAVIFEDREEAQACDSRIDAIRTEWFKGRPFEFHFNSCSRDIRQRFLVETAKFEYVYMSFIFNKAKLYGEGFQYKNSFYKYAVNLLFQNLKPYLKNATVIFDRCGNRDFQRELKKYLGKRVNERGREQAVKNIKTNNSESNNLLQLADMVCGTVARFLRKAKPDHLDYRRIISHRELLLKIWPR
ncbi:MAG: DUF3800 domain-containing protein [Acidobacteriales bacterium]|nr:DUF3800 domain-containing protein [Terriglobales bacterium]